MPKERINQGSELLIPKEEWISPNEMLGQKKVLNSPLLNKAFKRILELHKPKSNIAFVSLCTSTRPYSKSVKWQQFLKYKDDVDLIVCSNGGIIPIDFEECYPYLTYDSLGEKKYDKLYTKKTYVKFKMFFEKFDYEYIIFNLRPSLAIRKSALLFKQKSDNSDNIFIYPSKETFLKAKKDNFKPFGHYYPDASYPVMEELDKIIKNIKKV